MSLWLDPETELRPEDRVLVLGMASPAALRAVATRLHSGVVVVVAEDDEVCSGRRELRDVPNVMFVPATPDQIPWQDGYFTRVIDTKAGSWPDPERVAREIARVVKRPD